MKNLTFILAILIAGCANKNSVKDALRKHGLHPISVNNTTGCMLYGCSEDDDFKASFTAYTADSSKIVSGCVCGSYIRDYAIRLD